MLVEHEHIVQSVKVAADVGAFGVTVGAIAGWLPPIAAAMSILWLGMQMYAWVKNKKWISF